MPKIIKNVRENIISSTKEIILEKGFNALTMRDVAKRLDMALEPFITIFQIR